MEDPPRPSGEQKHVACNKTTGTCQDMKVTNQKAADLCEQACATKLKRVLQSQAAIPKHLPCRRTPC